MKTQLYGLILAGGHSRRMGVDKATLSIQGQTLLSQAEQLLGQLCERVFASARPQQFPEKGNVISDLWVERGPASGLVSAHLIFPERDWLVMPVDMPKLGTAVLGKLMTEIRSLSFEVALFDEANVNPLLGVWRASALQKLKIAFLRGVRSPREFLESLNVVRISTDLYESLQTFNTPEEWADCH